MDSGGNVVVVGGDNWMQGAVWATEDEYSEPQPPNKKSRNSQSKAIGKMFFKTKLCCKFRAGTCPYVTNCNFAHSIEELRRPPPNWQEIVAAHEEDPPKPNEEFQIPSTTLSVETPRSSRGRHCKKFYSEEGCPYGDNCTFLHDQHSKNRESVVISLGPGGGYAPSNGNGNGNGVVVVPAGAAAPSNAKPSNWKTRICNKWELTGYCPFRNKCHFAHGAAELHRYGGGLVDTDTRDCSTVPPIVVKGGRGLRLEARLEARRPNSAPEAEPLEGFDFSKPRTASRRLRRTPQRLTAEAAPQKFWLWADEYVLGWWICLMGFVGLT